MPLVGLGAGGTRSCLAEEGLHRMVRLRAAEQYAVRCERRSHRNAGDATRPGRHGSGPAAPGVLGWVPDGQKRGEPTGRPLVPIDGDSRVFAANRPPAIPGSGSTGLRTSLLRARRSKGRVPSREA